MSASLSAPAAAHQIQSAHCPACGESALAARRAWKFINARGETEWLRCPECRSFFMDGEYSLEAEVSHTQQMTWGDTEQGEQLNSFKQRMYAAILDRIERQIDFPNKRLLDVGCSYGGFMEAAMKRGMDVTGFDIVPEAVQRVTDAGMKAQCCAQVRDFDLTTEPFDVISVLDANIYWPDQPQELADIHSRLTPGGLLVMRVVDKSWMARIGAAIQSVSPRQAQKILRRSVNDHRFSMPVSSILKVVERSGFDVISASPKGAIHSDQTSLPVKLTFAMGIALWKSVGVFLAPGAVIIAERRG
jgi:2-polyprenyl-3-methyl-5-hydroxy-6-metoxy-1,4-benzoquinol methylase